MPTKTMPALAELAHQSATVRMFADACICMAEGDVIAATYLLAVARLRLAGEKVPTPPI